MLSAELNQYVATLLDVTRFNDYCPNGLQIEGRGEIRTLISGVTASLALLEAALDYGADAVIVHHGYFWKNESAVLTGIKRQRIALLLQHDISLFAWHLPLDAHPELGNNAQLGQRLGFQPLQTFGDQNLGWVGELPEELSLAGLTALITDKLGREPLVIGDSALRVSQVAWCTGAAQSYFESAIAQGVQAFITGEISESQVHLARETGVAFISAGHHATERYGIQALGQHLETRFSLRHQFFDLPNPV